MKDTRDCHWPLGLAKPFVSHERTERRDAREHRQQILEVARCLFAEQGVHAVSMHQIAQKAGIGQGTLYRRYANKGELCMDLLRERHDRFAEEIAELATAVVAPALDRLEGALKRTVAFLEDNEALLSPIAQTESGGWQCNTPVIAGHFASQSSPMSWLHDLFAGLLNEALAKGEIAPLDVTYTADAILFTLHPLFYRFQRLERGLSPEYILQALCHLYIAGLKVPAGSAQ